MIKSKFYFDLFSKIVLGFPTMNHTVFVTLTGVKEKNDFHQSHYAVLDNRHESTLPLSATFLTQINLRHPKNFRTCEPFKYSRARFFFRINFIAYGGSFLARAIRLAARTLESFHLESPKFLTSLLCLLDTLWLNFR